MNRRFEEWVNGDLTDAQFYAEVDIIQQKGAQAFVKNMGIDTSEWGKGGAQ